MIRISEWCVCYVLLLWVLLFSWCVCVFVWSGFFVWLLFYVLVRFFCPLPFLSFCNIIVEIRVLEGVLFAVNEIHKFSMREKQGINFLLSCPVLCEGKFQWTSALAWHCIVYLTIVFALLFVTTINLKMWIWKLYLPTYKRKEFTVLVRRGKKSEAGIMILSQSFVSWMEKVTTNPLELFLWCIQMQDYAQKQWLWNW